MVDRIAVAFDETDVAARMRLEWNERAVEDAHFYVAFGRRDQAEEEFFDSGADVVRALTAELKRLPAGAAGQRKALEIGCGPGRLVHPMSRHFGEIHGVDVSDEMIRRARHNLRGVPHAHVHVSSGSDLAPFVDQTFDLVYSYAVFQHIPSRDVVFAYLTDAWRVLRPGGILKAQLNGLPPGATQYDTWSGVRITREELETFAAERGFQMLALEGAGTQYMWITWRKPLEPVPHVGGVPATNIVRITNAHNSEPVVPARGRLAAASLWVRNLPAAAGIADLGVEVAGKPTVITYIGHPDAEGLQQVNVRLAGCEPGLARVDLRWRGVPIADPGVMRVIAAGPAVPRIVSASDGINLLAGTRVHSRTIKLTVEETAEPRDFRFRLGGLELPADDVFCTDPIPPRHEINLRVPGVLAPGWHQLEATLGHRQFAPIAFEIVL